MRKLWACSLGIVALMLLASSPSFGASFTAQQCSVGAAATTAPAQAKDVFLQQLAKPASGVSTQPVTDADVICCVPGNCCELISQASCRAQSGTMWPSAFLCNEKCSSC